MLGFIAYRTDYFEEEAVSILDIKRITPSDSNFEQTPPPDSIEKTKVKLVFDSLSEEEKERFFIMSSSKSIQVPNRGSITEPSGQHILDTEEAKKVLMPSSKVLILPELNQHKQGLDTSVSLQGTHAESLFQFVDTAQ